MSKYSVEMKLEILGVWKEQATSRASIARKYGVASQMIRQWEKQYELRGEDGLVPRDETRNNYTGEFRVQVAEEAIKGELSLREIEQKHDLNRALLLRWKRLYLENGPEYLRTDHRGRRKALLVPDDMGSVDVKALWKENEELKAEVSYLKKLNALVQKKEHQEKKHR